MLSAAFRHPDPAEPTLGRALAAAAAALPYRLPEFAVPELPVQELRLRYTNLFEASDRSGAISLHESDFVPTPRAKVWEDLVRFYEHFGLRYDGEVIHLWPDHLAIELECLQYLTFLEAGIAGDITPLLRAERDFIDRHLLPWLPDLAGQLVEREEAERGRRSSCCAGVPRGGSCMAGAAARGRRGVTPAAGARLSAGNGSRDGCSLRLTVPSSRCASRARG